MDRYIALSVLSTMVQVSLITSGFMIIIMYSGRKSHFSANRRFVLSCIYPLIASISTFYKYINTIYQAKNINFLIEHRTEKQIFHILAIIGNHAQWSLFLEQVTIII